MARVQQEGIGHHQRGFEDPEVPLVAQDRGERGGVGGGEVQVGGREVLDGAVDGAGADEGGGDVQGGEHGFEVGGEDPGFLAAPGEEGGEDDEEGEDDELEDEGDFEEGAAEVGFAGGDAAGGDVGGAVAVEDLDDGGQGAEGGEDAAWVDGGVVWDVVEDAGEDEVVCEFV